MASIGISVDARRVKAMLKRGQTESVRAAAKVMTAEAQLVMRESKQQVPLLSGTLRASGRVRPAGVSGANITAARMTYGGAARAYAHYQHREHNPPFHYSKPGTGPNYLKGPFEEARARIRAHVAAAIKATLKG